MSAKCANPLFAEWLNEWYEEHRNLASQGNAVSKNAQWIYKKAYNNILKYPLPLADGNEAQKVHGIGPSIASRLNDRLKKLGVEVCSTVAPVPSSSAAAGRRGKSPATAAATGGTSISSSAPWDDDSDGYDDEHYPPTTATTSSNSNTTTVKRTQPKSSATSSSSTSQQPQAKKSRMTSQMNETITLLPPSKNELVTVYPTSSRGNPHLHPDSIVTQRAFPVATAVGGVSSSKLLAVILPQDDHLNLNRDAPAAAPPPAKKSSSKPKKEYVPAYRSGPYAILIALYHPSKYNKIYKSKQDIIRSAQAHCDSSFEIPSHQGGKGGFYNAWSSMVTLERRDLVGRHGHPPRFSLTDEGWDLAVRLSRVGSSIDAVGNDDDDEEEDMSENIDIGHGFGDGSGVDGCDEMEDVLSGGEVVRNSRHQSVERLDQLGTPLTSSSSLSSTSSSQLVHSNKRTAFSPFHYSYLNEQDRRVEEKGKAFVDIGDSGLYFKIEFHKSQDTHPLARAVIKKRPMGDFVCGFLRDDDALEFSPGLPPKYSNHSNSSSSSSNVNSCIGDGGSSTSASHPLEAFPRKILSSGSSSHAMNWQKQPSTTGSSHSTLIKPAPAVASGSNVKSAVTHNHTTSSSSKSLSSQKVSSAVTATTTNNNIRTVSARSWDFSALASSSSSSSSSFAESTTSNNTANRVVNGSASSSKPTAFPFSSSSSCPASQFNFNANTSSPSSNQPLVFKRGTFDILMIIDTREMNGQLNRTFFQDMLGSFHDVDCVQEPLPVGDMTWVARRKRGVAEQLGRPRDEYILLDTIVERKTAADLVSSIKDGRFEEQKYRLRHSGLGNIIYLVEETNIADACERVGRQTILTAMTMLHIADGVSLKRTSGPNESVSYLASVTNYLKSMYINKDLYGYPKGSEQFLSIPSSFSGSSSSQICQLMTYDSFKDCSDKSRQLTRKDMMIKHMLSVKGMSVEKAAAVVAKFPTWMSLMQAYESCDNERDGQLLLNQLGGIGRREIGVALSKKVWKLFNAQTYDETDNGSSNQRIVDDD